MKLPFQNLGRQLQILFLYGQQQFCHQTREFQVGTVMRRIRRREPASSIKSIALSADDDLKHNDRQVWQLKLMHHLRLKPYGGFHSDHEDL